MEEKRWVDMGTQAPRSFWDGDENTRSTNNSLQVSATEAVLVMSSTELQASDVYEILWVWVEESTIHYFCALQSAPGPRSVFRAAGHRGGRSGRTARF